MVATPSEHYAKADELLGSLHEMDTRLQKDYGMDMLVPEELNDWLRDIRKYTVELAAVHATLAGVPPIVADLAAQEARKAAEDKLRDHYRRPVQDVPQA